MWGHALWEQEKLAQDSSAQASQVQAKASSTTPVLNVPLFQRLTKKLTDAEHALQILDLARDLPRSDTDVHSAVTAWLNIGTELAKPHFQALLVAVSKFIPALTNGIYRYTSTTPPRCCVASPPPHKVLCVPGGPFGREGVFDRKEVARCHGGTSSGAARPCILSFLGAARPREFD